MDVPLGEITALLSEARSGDTDAASRLMEFVYDELHRLAGAYMRRERPGHTLQPTALVNEAYVRLLKVQDVEWRSRAHFLGIAGTMMRRVLVEYARARKAAKRGGLQQRIELTDQLAAMLDAQAGDLLDLDNALEQLAQLDQRLSRTVELRYFGGLSFQEAAEVLGVSSKTVKRDWAIAKAWLKNKIGNTEYLDERSMGPD